MNSYLIIGILFTLLSAYFIHKDIRRFRNAVAVFIAFIFLMEGLLVESEDVLPDAYKFVPIMLIMLIVLGTMLFLVIDTFILIKREGFHLVNLLPMFLLLFSILIFIAIVFVISQSVNMPYLVTNICIIIILTILFFYFLFSCFLVYSIIYGILPRNPECEYIIIHGAGLNKDKVTPLLAKRIEKGVSLYHRGKDQAMLIVSGGKGSDELISEAEAMKRYLLDKGIDKTKIILEDRSTTTLENLEFSKKIMDERSGSGNYRCYFVTNNYHAFRTGVYSRRLGINGSAVGCRTALYYWPAAFLREYFALLKHYRWKILVTLIPLLILAILAGI